MRKLIRVSLAILCGLSWAGAAAAAPLPEKKKLTPEEIAKCAAAVKEYLAQHKADAGMLQLVKDEAIERVLPSYATFNLWFRQYPVARAIPQGFAAADILVCDAAGKVQLLKNAKELTDFFKANLPAAKTDAEVTEAGRAYVRLAQELHQDGFYKFKRLDTVAVKGGERGGKSVTLTVVVMQGGSGMLEATLEFDGNGKLVAVAENNKIKPGPRPICQATKLLDADPIVRRLAEQDLLIMGRAAKPYLDEQCAQATPELQRAIDRLWQRIVESDR